jgi:hypothetical protein
MQSRHAVALLVILALGLASALAHASPPDPTWIGGVYDGGDGDDAVLVLTSADLANDGAAVEPAARFDLVLGGAVPRAATARGLAPAPALRDRAPPLVLALRHEPGRGPAAAT